MHRQTIDAYDADAEHWLTTRYKATGPSPFALGFRTTVGNGLILDLGCGPGQLLGDLGPTVVGADASIGMLTLAARHANAPLVQADAVALPFADGVFAGVFANFSLQHLPRLEFGVAVAETFKTLRRGGYLEVTMHDGDAETLREQPDGVRENDDVPGGRWFTYWKAAQVVDVLEAEGFSDIAVDNLGYANRYLARKP
jgi:SAM-dependent methyltransferase